MKEKFIDKDFNDANYRLIVWADRTLNEYVEQGYRVSLRQLYYVGVSQNLYPNDVESYKRLGNIIADARLAGLIDWDAIEDRGRVPRVPTVFQTGKEALWQATSRFRLNSWEDQPKHVEVMVEKSALEGVVAPICNKYKVPFHANKGYSSASALYEVGKGLQERAHRGKELVIIYAGDHDPSGVHMTTDVHERLTMFSGSQITVYRVALNMKQIERYNPPPQFSKPKDSRTESYIKRFGRSECWELDSLTPSVLSSIIEASIRAQIDFDKWDKSVEREMEIKDYLQTLTEDFDD
jgi:hypothetical protein